MALGAALLHLYGCGELRTRATPDAGAAADGAASANVMLEVEHVGDGDGVVRSDPLGLECTKTSSTPSTCRARFLRGTTVALVAIPHPSSVVEGWSVSECLDGTRCLIEAQRDERIQVRFSRKRHQVLLGRQGDGQGHVRSLDGALECGERCSASIPSGTTLMLEATPLAGSTFAGWSGDCSGSGPTCRLTVDETRVVGAAFDLGKVSLSVSVSGDGEGVLRTADGLIACPGRCSASYDVGTSVRLEAYADQKSFLGEWTGACTPDRGSSLGPSPTCELKLEAATNVGLSFVAARVVVEKTGDGAGRVVSEPEGIDCGDTCEHRFNVDSVVDLTAVPGPHADFAGWGKDCAAAGTEPTSETSCRLELSIPRSRDVSADFRRKQYRLSVQRSGDGAGVVRSEAAIDCGDLCEVQLPAETTVELRATPSAGSTFRGWSGACAGMNETCTVLMDRARSVTASFNRNLVELTVSVLGDGEGVVQSADATIACPPDCAASYPEGESVTLSVTPNTATSVFEGWSGACSGANGCSVRLTEPNTSVVATLSRTRISVSVAGLGSGAVTMSPGGIRCTTSCSRAFPNNTQVTLTAEPLGHDMFEGWSGACSGATGRTCQVTVRGVVTTAVSFRKPRVPIVPNSNPDATLVLGQDRFTDTTDHTPVDNLWSLREPRDCGSDGTRLWISDSRHARVLQWNTEPTRNAQPASLVLGQSSPNSTSTGSGLSSVSDFLSSIVPYQGALYLADSRHSRILAWNTLPTVSGTPADYVIGQDSVTYAGGGVGRAIFYQPRGAVFAGSKMIVADSSNNRVLIFNQIPRATGRVDADEVLGQEDFTSKTLYTVPGADGTLPAGAATPPTSGTMAGPFNISYDPVGDRLYVPDTGNHRVLVWNGIPRSVRGTVTPASFVIGQPDGASIERNRGRTTEPLDGTMLASPRAAIVAYGSLFVSDAGNRRVLIWTPPPDGPNVPATAVLGQRDVGSFVPTSALANSFDPWGLCAMNSHLYVVSLGQNRVLRFDLNP
ncbi:MAG: hypothetical protein IPK13_11705 [Deltaproteobacteria bacterium]|nr:hypothetical protein [Deltaproteobacteria bacterium]